MEATLIAHLIEVDGIEYTLVSDEEFTPAELDALRDASHIAVLTGSAEGIEEFCFDQTIQDQHAFISDDGDVLLFGWEELTDGQHDWLMDHECGYFLYEYSQDAKAYVEIFTTVD